MGKNLLALGCLLVAAGCSGSESDGSDDEPVDCSAADRMGSYLVQFTELDGDCGPLPDQIVRLTDDLAEGCVLDDEPVVSSDQCRLENSVTCTDAGTGQTVTLVGVTTQQNDSGSLITGTATATVRDSNGVALCLSTYSLRYERQ